ncbi:amidohydrolase [Artomyces pyxidatus]|uniref:Amidohydrolase n=1 Tax=Artomyces pyxidatus TaxID=48021 RepID=A0ACB8SXL8_9AGAM|nr:amidohydrolase [Artomyces pyxidatus]
MSDIQAGCFSALLRPRRRKATTTKPALMAASEHPVRGPPPYSPAAPREGIYRPEVMETIEATLATLDVDLHQLSLSIHDHPELNFQERFAHDALTAFMAARGFAVTPHYLGLETAWRAEFVHMPGAKGARVVGVNAEMDALPGVGHACGHNLIAVAGVGVALALAAALRAHNTPGTVVLLGTPAEEAGGGKQLLLERGAYEEMNVCVMCHPMGGATQAVGFAPTLALQVINVEFFGHAAHAAFAPWEGVNALDAAFLAYGNVSALRQQLKPDQRVHGIVQGRDWTPNVIPDYAKMAWIVRASVWDDVVVLRDRVIKCLDAAAMATGCTHSITFGDRYRELHQNRVLAEDLAATAREQYGVPTSITGDVSSASTDFVTLPSIHPTYNIPTDGGAQNHTPGFTRASRTPEAHTATMLMARMLALTGFRVLDDGAFFEQVGCGAIPATHLHNDIFHAGEAVPRPRESGAGVYVVLGGLDVSWVHAARELYYR